MNATAIQRAIIADAHPLALDAVERVVKHLGIEVSGRTTNVESVVELVADHGPDLLVLGVELVDEEVQQLLRVALQSRPALRVVLISDEDPSNARAAFTAGVDVYCTRAASEDDLAVAVRQSFERSIHLPPIGIRADELQLTQREAQVLRLVAEGLPNAEIARTLWVTPQTVKFHLSNIYRKLGVHNRIDARRWAQQHRLVDVDSHPPTADRKA
jgi:DNA-binding NarL/FixJ family response regulator